MALTALQLVYYVSVLFLLTQQLRRSASLSGFLYRLPRLASQYARLSLNKTFKTPWRLLVHTGGPFRAVHTVTRLRAGRSGIRSPVGENIYFFFSPDWLWDPPNLLFTGYRIYFPGIKRSGPEVNDRTPASAKVEERMELSTCIHPHASTAWTEATVHTGCGRNSELIINKHNILLKVIDTKFSTPQRSMLTKSEDHCLCSNTCTPRYPSGEARNSNFKILHYFCRTLYFKFSLRVYKLFSER